VKLNRLSLTTLAHLKLDLAFSNMDDENLLTLVRKISESLERVANMFQHMLPKSNAFHSDSALLSNYSKVEVCRDKFGTWRKLWTIDKPESAGPPEDSHLEVVWGHSATERIRALLKRMSETAENLDMTLVTAREKQMRPNPSSRWKRLIEAKRISNERKSNEQTANQAIIAMVGDLSEQIEFLRTVSEMYFRTNQPKLSRSRPDRTESSILQNVERARRPFLALYRYISQSEDQVRLRMDIFDDRHDKLCIHISLRPSEDTQRELIITLLDEVPSEYQGLMKRINMDSTEDDTVVEQTLTPSLTQDLYLRYSRSSATIYFHIHQQSSKDIGERIPLSLLFGNTSSSGMIGGDGTMSLFSRIELAFKVVECGLWLLGTPWLSSLNSDLLTKMGGGTPNPHYALPVNLSPFDEEEDEIISTVSRSGQISAIGVLLTEIALQAPYKKFRRPSGDPDASLAADVGAVEVIMGRRYGKAVEFCLRSIKTRTNSWKIDSLEGNEISSSSHVSPILEEYHANVYLG
jgi:hypothetical protein